MFQFARTREVLWPVTVSVPADGGPQDVEVRIRYRLLTRTELRAMAGAISGVMGGAERDVDTVLGTLDAQLAERITGWDGIAGEDGEPLAFSAENLAALLDQPYLREAIERGLYAASRGALAKN